MKSTMEETVKEDNRIITNEIEKNTDSEGNIIEKALSKSKMEFQDCWKKGKNF